jgi:RNA polymerase sigma factor (sigma-70 family)
MSTIRLSFSIPASHSYAQLKPSRASCLDEIKPTSSNSYTEAQTRCDENTRSTRMTFAYNGELPINPFLVMKSATARAPASPRVQSESIDAQMAQLAVWLESVQPRNAAAQIAFRQLYDATVSRVYAVARRITTNDAHAEEVVSDTYMQVWRDASRFDPARGNVIAWLSVIARTRALDLLRKQEDWIAIPEAQALEIVMLEAQSTDELGLLAASATLQPDDWAEALEAKSQLAIAMRQLRPVQRQLLALAYFKGLSHQEISDNTGLALGTVKTHIRRALAKLKTELDV